MMQLNPNAIGFWIFASGLGYLINGTSGAIAGLVVASGISTLVALFRRD